MLAGRVRLEALADDAVVVPGQNEMKSPFQDALGQPLPRLKTESMMAPEPSKESRPNAFENMS